MDLASELARGVEALRSGEAADAATILQAVVDDEGFRAHPELQDVRARACSLLAQALLSTDQVGPADRYAREALDALENAPDDTGRAQIDELRREIMGRALTLRKEREQRSRRSRLRQIPVPELLAAAKDDDERTRLLIERATAESEAGDEAAAIRLADRARNLADKSCGLKEQVLSRLLVAQVDARQRVPALQSAYQLALAADEKGLITGIARTAEQVGTPLHVVDGGQ
ncbi:MAG: hypothetical protein KC912_05285 [Proteobacteria bacterium]|nr:hypothetical protein [Pseudomonadota bacterium]